MIIMNLLLMTIYRVYFKKFTNDNLSHLFVKKKKLVTFIVSIIIFCIIYNVCVINTFISWRWFNIIKRYDSL